MQITTKSDLQTAYQLADNDSDIFWRKVAENFHWYKPFSNVSKGTLSEQNYRWFVDGRSNLSVNCLDRHLPSRAHQTALIYEPNSPEQAAVSLTYQELSDLTNRTANALLSLGITKGDRVVIYAPMRPETIASMLACTRIGAIHVVVFAGFSAQALADRIQDTQARAIITAQSLDRGEKKISLLDMVSSAQQLTGTVLPVLAMDADTQKHIISWNELVSVQSSSCPPVSMDSEDPLFILYTSGSTGKPKGLVHTLGGYMVYAGYSFQTVFQPQPSDVFWCTADVGWITGHTYLTYGPLLNGLTTVIFGGTPVFPDPSRYWKIIERHRVNILYTAPTVIRTLAAQELSWFDGHDLSSLRVLGSVGEPLNAQAWEWYHTNVGGGRCPVVDTWWQTETGGILISSLAGLTQADPGSAGWALPGIEAEVVDDTGKPIFTHHLAGNLTITKPWPSLARGIWGDSQRFKETYLTHFPGRYWTGDGAWQNTDLSWRITGRVDDVINVSGHRIGTAEVENVLTKHPAIVEAAVVGYPHDIKGEGLYAFVVCYQEFQDESLVKTVRQDLHKLVTEHIGGLARPDFIQVVPNLPKTRSGKIMRRLLRKLITKDEDLGDTSTLLEPTLLDVIKSGLLN